MKIAFMRQIQKQVPEVKDAIGEAGPFALVILGGAHDLADNVRKLAGRAGDYVRVTTRWGRRFGVEDSE
ncbi:MAG: hypothetical protein ABIP48_32470 [Planctomycetota bacterium]